jgi:hypothetical protein
MSTDFGNMGTGDVRMEAMIPEKKRKEEKGAPPITGGGII